MNKQKSGPSLTEAILDLVEFGTPKNTEIAEDHFEIQRQIKSTPELSGIMTAMGGRALYIPLERLGRRDMTVTGAALGSGLVGTMVRPISSDLLEWSAVAQQGAVFLNGLSSRTRLPLVTKLPTPEWHAEVGMAGATSAQLTTDAVILQPFRLSCRVTFSRQLMTTAVGNFDATLTGDIGRAMSSMLDQSVLYGSGAANNQPLGILSHPDTLKFNYAAGDPLWPLITSAEAAVSEADVSTSNLGWIMSPESFRRCRVEGVFGPGFGDLVSDKIMRPVVSNQCFNTHLFVGCWNTVVVGVFGALALIVNPYSDALNGNIQIVADLFCDVALRCPQALGVTSAPIVRGAAEEPRDNGRKRK